MNIWYIYKPSTSPALSWSLVLQHVKLGDALKIWDGIIFVFSIQDCQCTLDQGAIQGDHSYAAGRLQSGTQCHKDCLITSKGVNTIQVAMSCVASLLLKRSFQKKRTWTNEIVRLNYYVVFPLQQYNIIFIATEVSVPFSSGFGIKMFWMLLGYIHCCKKFDWVSNESFLLTAFISHSQNVGPSNQEFPLWTYLAALKLRWNWKPRCEGKSRPVRFRYGRLLLPWQQHHTVERDELTVVGWKQVGFQQPSACKMEDIIILCYSRISNFWLVCKPFNGLVYTKSKSGSISRYMCSKSAKLVCKPFSQL